MLKIMRWVHCNEVSNEFFPKNNPYLNVMQLCPGTQ